MKPLNRLLTIVEGLAFLGGKKDHCVVFHAVVRSLAPFWSPLVQRFLSKESAHFSRQKAWKTISCTQVTMVLLNNDTYDIMMWMTSFTSPPPPPPPPPPPAASMHIDSPTLAAVLTENVKQLQQSSISKEVSCCCKSCPIWSSYIP